MIRISGQENVFSQNQIKDKSIENQKIDIGVKQFLSWENEFNNNLKICFILGDIKIYFR